ncbi:glycosyltransferase [Methylocapsa sp. D3K7]|uniref:glycosyltransferase n=1 Tax=Methylocapsa sp. D3K7 TaxID=3041435 RepID=UPI00244E79E1|nr:glycosyltransferase [Methylocapsa sp. D3K7]WGJ16193.1 glycosyltransferase [Methylocapsa sp. D3K7]
MTKIDQRLLVFFLIPHLTAGGAERVIVTLLKYYDRNKFRLTLVVIDSIEAFYLDEIPKDIELIDLRTRRVRSAILKLVRIIWKRRPDVVVSTVGHLNLALSIAKPLLPKKTRCVARETSVVSVHLRGQENAKVWTWAYRTFYSRFDHIICQSVEMYEDLAANFAIPLKKLTVINNPVDIDHIKQLAGHGAKTSLDCDLDFSNNAIIHLVAVGRLVRQKGFDLLIEAIALSGLKQLRVTILGEGPLRKTLEQFARMKGVEHQVRFIGIQKNPYHFMARADAFVLCSRYEGCPNVVLEALACGTHVIATPAPGGLEEIERSTGGVRLTAAVSAASLSTELVRFTSNRPKIAQINLDQFRVDKIVKEYERILIGDTPRSGFP